MTRQLLVLLVLCGTACKSDKAAPPPPGPGTADIPPPPVAADAAGAPVVPQPPPVDYQAKVDVVLPKIRALAANATVVKAVQDQNAKKVSLDAIKKLDVAWTAAAGETADMKPYLGNKCAAVLKGLATGVPAMVEAFAMDDQGALVCTVTRTSDYWQGDEAKWEKSFNGGKGGELVDKPKFDESSQTYSVQVSVPVMDGGKAIGGITVGLSLDKL